MSLATPEDIVAGWQQWGLGLTEAPTVLKPLSGGLTNSNYLLDMGNKHAVLRVDSPIAQSLGLDREREQLVLDVIEAYAFSPTVVLRGDGFALTSFVEGRQCNATGAGAGEHQEVIALLQSVHLLDIALPAFDYLAATDFYWQQLDQKSQQRLADKARTMQPIVRDFNRGSGQGLCHHDPVPANFLFGPAGIHLLDWEYAANGSPVFDYAALVVEWGLPGESVARQAGVSAGDLAQGVEVYRWLGQLWAMVGENVLS